MAATREEARAVNNNQPPKANGAHDAPRFLWRKNPALGGRLQPGVTRQLDSLVRIVLVHPRTGAAAPAAAGAIVGSFGCGTFRRLALGVMVGLDIFHDNLLENQRPVAKKFLLLPALDGSLNSACFPWRRKGSAKHRQKTPTVKLEPTAKLTQQAARCRPTNNAKPCGHTARRDDFSLRITSSTLGDCHATWR